MSVFQPMNVAAAGQDQKRALLAKLMNQYTANASRAAELSGTSGASSPPTGATAVGAGAQHGRGPLGTGLVTGQLPMLAPGLVRLLGPGGVGSPIAGREGSQAPGLAIAPGLNINPRAGGSPIASPQGAPGTPAPPISPGPPAITPSGTVPGSGGSAGGGASASTSGLAPDQTGFVNLGNGLIYHPASGVTSIQGTRIGVM